MPRITIAAVVAMLLFLAPAASARPADVGYPAYPTPEVAPQKPLVMSERITDHPVPTADKNAVALVEEQESTSGSGNQGVAHAEFQARGRAGVQTGSLAGTTAATVRALEQERAYMTYGAPAPIEPAPAPAAGDDSDPWPLIGGGILAAALMIGAAVALVARPRRSRVAT
jgi:hypothetical protein